MHNAYLHNNISSIEYCYILLHNHVRFVHVCFDKTNQGYNISGTIARLTYDNVCSNRQTQKPANSKIRWLAATTRAAIQRHHRAEYKLNTFYILSKKNSLIR